MRAYQSVAKRDSTGITMFTFSPCHHLCFLEQFAKFCGLMCISYQIFQDFHCTFMWSSNISCSHLFTSHDSGGFFPTFCTWISPKSGKFAWFGSLRFRPHVIVGASKGGEGSMSCYGRFLNGWFIMERNSWKRSKTCFILGGTPNLGSTYYMMYRLQW